MFPFTDPISLSSGLKVPAEMVLSEIAPLLTEHRLSTIQSVIAKRRFSTAVVLDGLYDRGNISAVFRSGEGMGFANFHVIESSERFKEASRVTKGAEKWIEVSKWKTAADCIAQLKKDKVRIIGTTLENAVAPEEINWTEPCAIVFGNEKDGISSDIQKACDQFVHLPMQGFVQSYNISVAAALFLFYIQKSIEKNQTFCDLNKQQQDILAAHYVLRTLDSAEDILKEKLLKREKF